MTTKQLVARSQELRRRLAERESQDDDAMRREMRMQEQAEDHEYHDARLEHPECPLCRAMDRREGFTTHNAYDTQPGV